MVRRQSSLPNQFGYVPIAERKIQIATYAAKDHFSFVMSPMEWVIRGDRHELSFYPPVTAIFATEQSMAHNVKLGHRPTIKDRLHLGRELVHAAAAALAAGRRSRKPDFLE
jgi:hypothetical protein